MPRNMSIDEQLKGLSSHTPAMDASDNVAAVGSRHGSINEASPYPATITEGFLWLGDHKHASTDGVMRDLKITHVVDARLFALDGHLRRRGAHARLRPRDWGRAPLASAVCAQGQTPTAGSRESFVSEITKRENPASEKTKRTPLHCVCCVTLCALWA